MKRDSHQHRNHPLPTPPPSDFSSSASSPSTGKAKMWEDTEPDAGFDELLAVMGYQVKASDMSQVAEKLEQLEQVMGDAQKDGASQLGPDTVYYNPSDMNSWIETVLSEINPADGAHNQFQSASDYDLTAIPGKALYPQSPPGSPPPPNKRFRSNSGSSSSIIWDGPPQSVVGDSTRQMVVVDSQENGVRIVHTLLACAEAVQRKNLNLAEALVKQIGFLAVSQPGPMRKVATYFAEGLARRIYGLFPQNQTDPGFSDLLQLHFYETCPYLKFAHFTANQAILEAFTGKQSVHVIDFSLQQGMQWPALIQALALRPGGPPKFRLTGIGPPSSDNIDRLQDVGRNLASLANTVNVPFEFTGLIANSLVELQAPIFDIREGEAVAVNSIFELHPLLARRGGIEQVLSVVKEMKAEVVTVAEQEGNHNGPSFVDRFHESLHYYASLFDSLEAGGDSSVVGDSQNKVMSEIYLGRQICNVVATEGVDRVERHETLAQWRIRLGEAGFESVHLGSNAFKQASLLLALFNGGGGYRVEEDNGSLTLGWHTRQLIAVSAWKPCQN